MKKFESITVHIGLHKTGTTAIQSYFHDNRQLFIEQANLLYPEFFINHGVWLYSLFCDEPEHYLFNISHYDSIEEIHAANREHKTQIEDELSSSDCRHLLLSGEVLSKLSSNGIKQFKNWIEGFSDHVRVVVFVRNPIDLVESIICESIKQGETQENAYADCFRYPLYSKAIGPWSEIFINAQLLVIDYDHARSKTGGIIGSMADLLKIDEGVINGTVSQSVRKNERASAECVALYSRLNALRPYLTDGKVSENRLVDQIHTYLKVSGRKYELPKNIKNQIFSHFQSDIVWLENKYGIAYGLSDQYFIEEHKQSKGVNFSEAAISTTTILISDLLMNIHGLKTDLRNLKYKYQKKLSRKKTLYEKSIKKIREEAKLFDQTQFENTSTLYRLIKPLFKWERSLKKRLGKNIE